MKFLFELSLEGPGSSYLFLYLFTSLDPFFELALDLEFIFEPYTENIFLLFALHLYFVAFFRKISDLLFDIFHKFLKSIQLLFVLLIDVLRLSHCTLQYLFNFLLLGDLLLSLLYYIFHRLYLLIPCLGILCKLLPELVRLLKLLRMRSILEYLIHIFLELIEPLVPELNLFYTAELPLLKLAQSTVQIFILPFQSLEGVFILQESSFFFFQFFMYRAEFILYV